MTRSEITILPAGRGMDGLIATRVMRDTLNPKGWWYSEDGSKISTEDGGPNYYSTDVKQAFRVVRVLQLQRLRLCLQSLHRWDQDEDWVVVRWQAKFAPYYGPNFIAEGETPELAICRAALLSLGFDGTIECLECAQKPLL